MPKKKKKSKIKKTSSKKRGKRIKKKIFKKRKVLRRKSKPKKKITKKITNSENTSSELIFKTKPEWIKAGLANRSQYQKKYNEKVGEKIYFSGPLSATRNHYKSMKSS